MSLKKYQKKRDFKKTSEPKGGREKKFKKLIFVVQEHFASHHHYDFRLEVQGELVSFAIPKEFPKEPSEKRLAVQTENHPLKYADFEGEIPKGEYGAGKVSIWDKGTYEPLEDLMEKMIKEGKINFKLFGKKLKGKWALVRFRDSKKNWLLIKQKT
ncbi:DNA polymerase ligase N-terminal domain-containing protein [Patescibacteria group bacterium]